MMLRMIASLVTKARTPAAGRTARRAAEIEDMLRRRPLELSTDRC